MMNDSRPEDGPDEGSTTMADELEQAGHRDRIGLLHKLLCTVVRERRRSGAHVDPIAQRLADQVVEEMLDFGTRFGELAEAAGSPANMTFKQLEQLLDRVLQLLFPEAAQRLSEIAEMREHTIARVAELRTARPPARKTAVIRDRADRLVAFINGRAADHPEERLHGDLGVMMREVAYAHGALDTLLDLEHTHLAGRHLAYLVRIAEQWSSHPDFAALDTTFLLDRGNNDGKRITVRLGDVRAGGDTKTTHVQRPPLTDTDAQQSASRWAPPEQAPAEPTTSRHHDFVGFVRSRLHEELAKPGLHHSTKRSLERKLARVGVIADQMDGTVPASLMDRAANAADLANLARLWRSHPSYPVPRGGQG
ncbi:hypothetical protein ACPC54_30875 [Kitasatospora sp. NPDC094028]